jgi:hypothetical protein
MSEHVISAPTELEIKAAKVPHDIFLSNLIMNHILLLDRPM